MGRPKNIKKKVEGFSFAELVVWMCIGDISMMSIILRMITWLDCRLDFLLIYALLDGLHRLRSSCGCGIGLLQAE
jgi:hypothetical protein